jgi:hypothetical protein
VKGEYFTIQRLSESAAVSGTVSTDSQTVVAGVCRNAVGEASRVKAVMKIAIPIVVVMNFLCHGCSSFLLGA